MAKTTSESGGCLGCLLLIILAWLFIFTLSILIHGSLKINDDTYIIKINPPTIEKTKND